MGHRDTKQPSDRKTSDLPLVYSDLYHKLSQREYDSSFTFEQLNDKLLELLPSICLIDKTQFRLLQTGFYIILYDILRKCPVGSFVLMRKNHRWASDKVHQVRKSRNWRKFSTKCQNAEIEGINFENSGYERGHFVETESWNKDEEMASEDFHTIKVFCQVKGFKAYNDAEWLGRMLTTHADVLTITGLVKDDTRVIKIFVCLREDSTNILTFDFPNTVEEYSKLNCEEKRFCGNFLTDRSILRDLLFEMKFDHNVAFVCEEPIKGKHSKQKILKATKGGDALPQV